MSAPHGRNSHDFNSRSVAMTLERKLELLESRFTRPAGGTLDAAEQLLITTDAGTSSQHSFSFGASNPSSSQQSSLPSSFVRSRRRPELNTSFHAVERATARHLRKLAASSPIQGTSSSILSSSRHSASSQQTLLTSHVQPRIVAESPPVPVTPGISTPGTRLPLAKPGVARTLLPGNTGTPSDRLSKEASTAGAAETASTTTAGALSTATTGKRKSVPKRKHSSIQDRSQLVVNSHSNSSSGSSHTVNFGLSPDLAKRGRKDEKSSPVGICESSRDRSNPARVPKKTQGPANNRSIHDFFSSSHKKAHSAGGGTSPNDANSDGPNTKSDPSLASSIDLATDQIDWAAKCQKLEQLLQDKDEQLKAVTNNKTILHTALQAALEKTRQELDSVKQRMNEKQTAICAVLEDLLRWKSNQQAKDLRETLAADGARLGRIVYARAGMRALESWEEGYATKDLEHRKQALVAKRESLEARSKEVEGEENPNTFEAMEVREAIRMHFENLRIQEAELSKEEQSLNDEKGAHIRALKRVASEDASRFRHRPKLHDRYVLHCLLGKGGFSEVWRAYDLQELREVAVKIHQLDPRWPDSKKENYTKHVSREYEIHRNVRHPRIVSLYDVFEIDNNSFATVLECCKGTDLDTLLKSKRRLPERQARALLLQILSGMNYLSQPSGSRQGIIHYDLKPGNILFDEFGDAKITDFGLSKIVDTQDSADSMELTSQGAGTYWYLPPECFITNERVRISNKVDVWSIGVIYYQMLYGSRPFGEGQTQDKLLSDHTMLNAHQVHFPDEPEISQEGKGFIRQCLMYDQAFRPTIAQLCEQPYVVNHKFEK